MIEPNRPRKGLSLRRMALLGSVAAVAAAMLVGGPGAFKPQLSALTGPAQAAETTLQRPADFSDLIAKVKPAVISVRVKIEQGAQTSSSEDNGNERQSAPAGLPDGEVLPSIRRTGIRSASSSSSSADSPSGAR